MIGDLARRVGGHPRVEPLTALLLRARAVTDPARFVARELRHADPATYTLRTGVRVALRHNGADAVTLGEVFHERHYEPPAALADFGPGVILDLGANVGLFGAFALARWPEARIVAFEPDPSNAAVHERTISLNHAEERWELRRAAAAAADGELRFHASGDALSRLGDDGDLVVPARDVLPLIAEADLLKLDVEGGEWPLLDDPRFAAAPPRAVVLEYHPHLCPEDDPREAVLRRLRAAGLTETHELFATADGHGMLWAWRT